MTQIAIAAGAPGTERDVELRLDPSASDATLRTVLDAAGVDIGTASAVAVDGSEVEIDSSLAAASVHFGSTITPSVVDRTSPDDGGRELVILSGCCAGRTLPLPARAAVLGRDRRADLVVDDPTVSALHARLSVSPDGGCSVSDLRSTNGTRLRGAMLTGPTPLSGDAVVRFGGMHAAVRSRQVGDAASSVEPSVSGRIPFNRPPRAALPAALTAIAVPQPPHASLPAPRFGWAAVVAPLVLGLVMATIFGPLLAAFAIFSPVMVVGSWWEERRRARAAGRHAEEERRADTDRFVAMLSAAAAAERARRRALAPNLAVVLRRARGEPGMWQRRPGASDFGTVAIGLGDVGWSPPLAPAGGRCPDDLVTRLERSSVLYDVPVTVTLDSGRVIGISGDRLRVLGLARAMVLQAVVHHGPADLSLAVLVDVKNAPDWDWTKWLPHVQGSADGGRRWLASNDSADAR